ncbi:MAG: FKBP-type peptidyl-prolyl cis-trans isomerase [Acidiferrobacterales bacterium]
MSETITKDKVVSLTYAIIDQQGERYEYTDVPVNYVHGGKSDLFKLVEQELEGKTVGDKVEVVLSPDQGFGQHDDGLTFTDDIDNVSPELRKVGAQFEAQNANGDILQFVVTQIEDGKLTVDGNHPLAGQTVKFLVEVKGVRDATAQEASTGIAKDLYQTA